MIPSSNIVLAPTGGNTACSSSRATDTSALGERFVEPPAEAGVPPGVVSVVHGGWGSGRRAAGAAPGRAGDTLTGSRDSGAGGVLPLGRRQPQALLHLLMGGKNAAGSSRSTPTSTSPPTGDPSGRRSAHRASAAMAASRWLPTRRATASCSRSWSPPPRSSASAPGGRLRTTVGPVINGRGARAAIDSYAGHRPGRAGVRRSSLAARSPAATSGPRLLPPADDLRRLSSPDCGLRRRRSSARPTAPIPAPRDADAAIGVANGVR